MAEITTSKKGGGLSVAIAMALLGYGLVAALFDPLTWPIKFATAIPCTVLVVLAVSRGWHRFGASVAAPKRGSLWTGGFIVWFVLVAALVAVQMLNYYEWPRTVYPTLSSLAGQVYHIYPVRAASFWLWLWLGWYLLGRRRTQ